MASRHDTLSEKSSIADHLQSMGNASNDPDSSVLVTDIGEKMFVPQSILTENSSESSEDSEEDEIGRHGGYTHPLFESDHDPKTEDIYADVREKMEKLARADREKHFHLANLDELTHELDIPFLTAFFTYVAFAQLIFFGWARDIFSKLFKVGRYLHKVRFPSDDQSLYAPLFQAWESFFTRRMYFPSHDVFNRPTASNAGAVISVLERVSYDAFKTLKVVRSVSPKDPDFVISKEAINEEFLNGKFASMVGDKVTRKCLNLGSYNYLGFADDWNDTCAPSVLPSLERVPISCTSSRIEAGNTMDHEKLEDMIGEFIGQESVFVHNMGYNTNCTTIPALVGKGDLIVSDELNHTSICNGARASGAKIRVFKHNNVRHLEEVLKDAIVMGQPLTRRPYKKIMVIVEGIYSMEGEYCDLGPINKVCKKYGAYLYMDEAHSIGAMGPTGRGCCEYWGVNDVDIMMGTFSKSFGAMGGYVAGKKAVIDKIRAICSGSLYHNSISPIVCKQIMTALEIIMGKDGTNIGKQKIASLRDNSNYFRMRLNEMGLIVLGNYDSPVMPIMLYHPGKMVLFSRECFKSGLAVVVVGAPAVPLLESRARFCISAAHKREDLDRALIEIERIAKKIALPFK